MPPGSFIFIGTKHLDEVELKEMCWLPGEKPEARTLPAKAVKMPPPNSYCWYDVVGLHDTVLIQHLAEKLHLHPLAMEDVLNTGQRAKFESFPQHLFATAKMLRFDESALQVHSEQVSFLFNRQMLVTFQEKPGDTFEPVRQRMRSAAGLREKGTDYLVYALLDTLVDHYIYLIEKMGEKVDDLEIKVLEQPDQETLRQIYTYKRELHFVMKVVKPVRDLLINMRQSISDLLDQAKMEAYLKDLEGLVIHAIESVETYRNLLTDYLNLYHSHMSTKMNDIMKVLTIFSAIFIPLSFFAGVYGTNFEYFPELEYRYSYFIFWGVIVAVALTMLIYFKRRKWW